VQSQFIDMPWWNVQVLRKLHRSMYCKLQLQLQLKLQ
jgi:hypothetical protein